MATERKYLSLEKLGLYDGKIKKVITDGDAAALKSAKDYADGLASNYDAAGSAASALTEAKNYADGKDAAIQAAQKAADDAAAAAGVADGKAVAAQGEVDALETYVGTFTHDTAKTVVEYINAKTDGIATSGNLEALGSRVTAVEGDVATIKGDYLKSSDKEELEGKITAAQTAADNAQSAADAAQGEVDALETVVANNKSAIEGTVSTLEEKVDANEEDIEKKMSDLTERVAANETAVGTTLPNAIAKEKEDREAADEALDARLEEVEAFFKLAEGESLDTALDTLVEIQGYITGEGAAADQMVLDIAANAKAIADHVATDHDFAAADATLKSELNTEIAKKADKTTVEGIDGRVTTAEGKITTVEGKVSTLEGEMTTVKGSVATKAEAQALADAVEALEGVDAGQETRIAALEAKFGDGEGNVESQIAAAKQEAIDAAAADATTKANTAEANAKAEATRLDGLMNTRVAALEAIDHEHSNKALLDTYTQTEADLADAVAKKHAHPADMVEVTPAMKEAWDKVSEKATQTALQAEIDRATAKENELSAAIAAFVEISEEDINKLFQA